MEVGTEISQKIRSAIKAKLIELGAYVDDELPDYIMVMVANKKSREQMVSDLNLFLGKNTDVFAEWLHGLLGKLQTLSVDSNVVKDVKGKKKSESKKEKKGKKSNKTADGLSSQGKKAKSQKESINDKTTESKSKGPDDDKPKQTKDVNNVAKETQSETAEVEDVRQMLVTVAPTDELAAELETTEARLEQSQQTSRKGKPVTSESEIDKSKSIASRSTSERKRSVSPTERRVQSSSAPKKHKGLTSVVACIGKDEEEEEYDPLCPAVGSVASVVKVTGRKSKIPPALQANKDGTDPGETEMDTTEVMQETGEIEQESSELAQSEDNGPVDDSSNPKVVRLDQTASLNRVRTALMEVLSRSQSDQNADDIGAFCKNISCCLRKMNARNLAIAKLRIQKILFDYESSIESGGNDRWSGSTAGNASSSSGVGGNNIGRVGDSGGQISSSGGSRTTVTEKNYSNTTAPVNRSMDSPSLRPSQKPDNTLVSSSSKSDRLSLYHHHHNHHQNTLSSSQSNVSTCESNSSLLQTNTLQHPPSSFSTVHKHANQDPPQTISLDSLHIKRRSELESIPSSAKNSNSVLKFRPVLHNALNSRDNGNESPKLMSAEQLKGLAKNLKITISNRQTKSSDEDESSSDGSDEDESEEEEGEEVGDGSRVEDGGANDTEDSREIESGHAEKGKYVSSGGVEDSTSDILSAMTSAEDSDSHNDRNAPVESSRRLKH